MSLMPARDGGAPGVKTLTDRVLMLSLLKGVRSTLRRAFDVKVSLRTSNTQEALFRLSPLGMQYPRSYYKINGYNVERNMNNHAIARRGLVFTSITEDKQRLITQARLYRINLQCEFHYLTDDAEDASRAISALLAVSASRTLAFQVDLPSGFNYQTFLMFEDSINTDEADFMSDDKKAQIDLSLAFTVSGYVGRIDETVQAIKFAVHAEPQKLHEDFIRFPQLKRMLK